jgi:ABC-type uncharacterized transport system permease subunit
VVRLLVAMRPGEGRFPLAVPIQTTTDAEGLLMELAWAVVLILLSRWLFARGLRRYSAYGG